ncbi:MAG: hypothetical protein ACK4OM_02735 [Alphaproteobacteria bacterium]
MNKLKLIVSWIEIDIITGKNQEFKNLNNNLVDNIVNSDKYQTILNNNIDEALGKKEIKIKAGKITYSDKKFAQANLIGHSKSNWTEWLLSFFSNNVEPYQQYNFIRTHQKSANMINKNIDSFLTSNFLLNIKEKISRLPTIGDQSIIDLKGKYFEYPTNNYHEASESVNSFSK